MFSSSPISCSSAVICVLFDYFITHPPSRPKVIIGSLSFSSSSLTTLLLLLQLPFNYAVKNHSWQISIKNEISLFSFFLSRFRGAPNDSSASLLHPISSLSDPPSFIRSSVLEVFLQRSLPWAGAPFRFFAMFWSGFMVTSWPFLLLCMQSVSSL